MTTETEMNILKELPGYKAILRSVLKSQIQLLLEQLADNVGEESVILTASVTDGSLSHLGSNTGKGFVEGRDDLKSQFLGYCLKSHHLQQLDDKTAVSLQQQSRTLMPQHQPRRYRKRPSPYHLSSQNIAPQVSVASALFPRSIPVNHENGDNSDSMSNNNSDTPTGNDSGFLKPGSSQEVGDGEDGQSQDDMKVKQEKGEGEIGDNSGSEWGQGYGDETEKESSEQAEDGANVQSIESLGGIAFPGLDNSHHDFSKSMTDISPTDLKKALYPEGNSTTYVSSPIAESFLQQVKQEIVHPLPQQHQQQQQVNTDIQWCCYCNTFVPSPEYNAHVLSHCKPQECHICHRRFAGKQVLQTHMRLHSGEKPFRCDVPGCDRAFCARSGLVYHKKKHH